MKTETVVKKSVKSVVRRKTAIRAVPDMKDSSSSSSNVDPTNADIHALKLQMKKVESRRKELERLKAAKREESFRPETKGDSFYDEPVKSKTKRSI